LFKLGNELHHLFTFQLSAQVLSVNVIDNQSTSWNQPRYPSWSLQDCYCNNDNFVSIFWSKLPHECFTLTCSQTDV